MLGIFWVYIFGKKIEHTIVGIFEGITVGVNEGECVWPGCNGLFVGFVVGICVGTLVGTGEGACVGVVDGI